MEVQAAPYLEEENFRVLFDSVMLGRPPSDTVLDLNCVDGVWQYVE
ncbi:hypothetical protein [Thermoactinomyces mirandus]|uniref:Uncharacterized protein n=1 Tax=Thermoactinomyces mirandus TaxID=2756294 RepID=A0A7W2ARL9_9BACL|nr:hypothetical protein [Thermoactinomyces mirandus]MBA4601730.1 hypothetical protein [Thermoactinomyces mirandus]